MIQVKIKFSHHWPNFFKLERLGKILIILVFLLLIILGGLYFIKEKLYLKFQPPQNTYVVFLTEVYDKIQQNYWDKLPDDKLIALFVAGTEKLTNQSISVKPSNKKGLEKILTQTINNLSATDKKKEFSVNLADLVLVNLHPFSRSRLYVEQDEAKLKNTVENRNPEINQYQALGVDKNATAAEIDKTYQQKNEQLIKESSPEAKQKLAEVEKAYQVLADPESRKVYDVSGVEPTMDYKLLRPDIFYIHIHKFSPTTIDELVRITQKVDQGEILNTLILDLKDNIGGTIDGLPYFLGPFIGNDQYAYQFYHQGEKSDFKTKLGFLPSLVRYKKVIILINEGSQSTAEVMAATLKKYNVGVVIGTTSKGWGTVEKVFPLEKQIDPQEKYSLFLVHSLTLREDGQPIDGKGVDPVINTKDLNWESKLYSYYHYEELAKALKEVL